MYSTIEFGITNYSDRGSMKQHMLFLSDKADLIIEFKVSLGSLGNFIDFLKS